MEQKKIKINDVELLAVEVPQNLIDLGCEIALMNLPFGNEEIYFYLNNEPVHTISLSVKSCDYEIIGLVKVLSLDEVGELIGEPRPDFGENSPHIIKRYTDACMDFKAEHEGKLLLKKL